MKPILSEPRTQQLSVLTHKMKTIAGCSQSTPTDEQQWYVYNNRIGDWDEICLLSGTADGGTKQALIKVVLTGLSNDERTQLDSSLSSHGNCGYLGLSEYKPTHQHKLSLIHI